MENWRGARVYLRAHLGLLARHAALATVGFAYMLITCEASADALLPKSRASVGTHGWYLGGPHYAISQVWTNSGRIVFGRRSGDPVWPRFRICVLDPKSGIEQTYRAIMIRVKILSGMNTDVLPCADCVNVLWWTDGRLYSGRIRGSSGHLLLDTRTMEDWGDPVWLSDCKHWAVVYPSPGNPISSSTEVTVAVGSIDWHERPRIIRVNVVDRSDDTYYCLSAGTRNAFKLLQVHHENFNSLSVCAVASVQFNTRVGIRLDANHRAYRRLSNINAGSIVPFRNKVAWISSANFRSKRGDSGRVLSLHVADITNGRRYLIGHVFAKTDSQGYGDYLQCLSWLPDGTNLSYIYGDRLYRVRASK